MGEAKRFVVERDKWLRGGKDGNGSVADPVLLNHRGERCCLGFFGDACGLGAEDLEDNLLPSTVDNPRKWPAWLVSPDPEHGCNPESELANINDDSTISEAKRESQLSAKFAARGVEVEFR